MEFFGVIMFLGFCAVVYCLEQIRNQLTDRLRAQTVYLERIDAALQVIATKNN